MDNVWNEIDHFIIQHARSEITLTLGTKRFKVPYVRSFSAVPVGELLALVAGEGYLEISVNQGNAHKLLEINRDEKMHLAVRCAPRSVCKASE